MERLRAVLDVSAGEWLRERMTGAPGTVGGSVPRGYAAYARVLHPVEGPPGAPTTWAQVCARTGRTPHATMQWAAITTPAPGTDLPVGSEGRWEHVDVMAGHLQPVVLAPLLEVLAPATGQQECWHALWEGWGWEHGSSAVLVAVLDDGPPPPPPAPEQLSPVLEEAFRGPRLRLPGRDHLLFAGPLSAALATGRHPVPDWFLPQSPNLLWPADRSWCLATEIDVDSTLVGGPVRLVEELLAAPGVEAYEVGEDDDLTVWGDRVNV